MNLSRAQIFQIHSCLQLLCFAVALISRVFFGNNFGIFTLLALTLPIIGFFALHKNKLRVQRRKLLKGYYLVSCLSTCFSMLFLSQKLFRTMLIRQERFFLERSYLPIAQNFFVRNLNPAVWSVIIVVLTTVIILGLIYLLLFGLRQLNLVNLGVMLIGGLVLNIFIYQFVLSYFLFPTISLFLTYLFWVLTTTVTLFTCFDLKIMLQRR